MSAYLIRYIYRYILSCVDIIIYIQFIIFIEIHTASQKWYLKSNTDSEIEDWFKVLHKAAVSKNARGY